MRALYNCVLLPLTASPCASSTGHVIAALVLFNVHVALRARLGVGVYPGDVLAFVCVLLDPCTQLRTGRRLVPFGSTRAAEHRLALGTLKIVGL